MYDLDRCSGIPLFQQLADNIRADIESGRLQPSSRLPSVREMARACAVSLITVTNSYNRLVAVGMLTAKPASGYYVAQPGRPPQMETIRTPLASMSVDAEWLLSHVFEQSPSTLMPGCGWLPAEWLDGDGIRDALGELARKTGRSMLSYGNPHGYLPLRQALQRALRARDIEVDTGQLVLTQGATQALSLCAQVMLSPGDCVLVDEPMYANLIALLRLKGYKVIGVTRTADGPDLARLEALAREHRPRVFFTNTNLQNPTGTTTSISCAHRVLRVAEQYQFVIVEDDIFVDLQHERSSSLAALDQLDRVIHIGSLSKSISPSLRVGFIACSRELAAEFTQRKMMDGLTTCEISEKLATSILTKGHHRLEIERLRQRCAGAQRTVAASLERCGLRIFHRPEAGMFLWARFEQDVDTAAVARLAAASNITLAPGRLFSTDDTASPWLRFNVAHSNDPELYRFLEKIAARGPAAGAR
jgi:DNA-binding transcriptional MocR family regulator